VFSGSQSDPLRKCFGRSRGLYIRELLSLPQNNTVYFSSVRLATIASVSEQAF